MNNALKEKKSSNSTIIEENTENFISESSLIWL